MKLDLDDILDCKYLVVKWDDIEDGLTDDEFLQLDKLIAKVEQHRERQGKPALNRYIVINTDEPYASSVATIMKFYGNLGDQ